MKRQWIEGVVLLLVLVTVNAQEQPVENYYDYQYMDLDFTLNAAATIDANEGQSLAELIVDVSLFPKTEQGQEVQQFEETSTPLAQVTTSEQYKRFLWNNVQEDEVTFGLHATARVYRQLPRIFEKREFPLEDLDPELVIYTEETEFIDITPAIEAQALAIIGSEDDAYKVVFKLAEWVKKTIAYDLSTLTAEAVQKSSWVLEHKEGVCDELTNLFISLARSLGIPARFVSGMVYSNMGYTWGPHGWAEVYFPNVGWVPFDVTFGQYGWLDPSHLKLKDDTDSGTPATEYEWQSADVEVDVQAIDVQTQVLSTGPRAESMISLTLETQRKAAAQGSVVPLFVTIENKKPFYLAPTVIVTKAPGIRGSNAREILLSPGETKTIGFLVEIPEEAEEGYVYTSQIEVVSPFGGPATSQIRYGTGFEFFNEDIAEEMVNAVNVQAVKQQMDKVKLSCTTDKGVYYANEGVKIICTAKNQQSSAFEGRVCVLGICKQVALAPQDAGSASFDLKASQSGRVAAAVEGKEGVAYAFFDLEVVKVPEVTIANVQPKTVQYTDAGELAFDIVSDEKIEDVVVQFAFKELNVGSIDGEKKILVSTSGKFIVEGLKVKILYKDAAGKAYEKKEVIKIKVENVPVYARVLYWVKSLFG